MRESFRYIDSGFKSIGNYAICQKEGAWKKIQTDAKVTTIGKENEFRQNKFLSKK